MLTIDDPELERFIHDEAARTGEEPAAVLRRYLPELPMRQLEPSHEVTTEEQARRLAVTCEIQRELAALPRFGDRPMDTILGYDDHGLPT